jgi:hypothetical protein
MYYMLPAEASLVRDRRFVLDSTLSKSGTRVVEATLNVLEQDVILGLAGVDTGLRRQYKGQTASDTIL